MSERCDAPMCHACGHCLCAHQGPQIRGGPPSCSLCDCVAFVPTVVPPATEPPTCEHEWGLTAVHMPYGYNKPEGRRCRKCGIWKDHDMTVNGECAIYALGHKNAHDVSALQAAWQEAREIAERSIRKRQEAEAALAALDARLQALEDEMREIGERVKYDQSPLGHRICSWSSRLAAARRGD